MCAQLNTPDYQWSVVDDNGREVQVRVDGHEYLFVRLTWHERSLVVQRAVSIDTGGVELTPTIFAHHLLSASLHSVTQAGGRQPITADWLDELPVDLGDRLTEIALYLNGRKSVATVQTSGPGETLDVEVGQHTYRLTPWTWGQRNRALQQAIGLADGIRPYVDTTRFYSAVLQTMCVAIDGAPPPDDWLYTLLADTGDALLDAALPMSGQDRDAQERLGQALRAQLPDDGIALYTLCKEFGWTPAQVRTQRAVDIDTLMTMHRIMAQPRSKQSAGLPVADSAVQLKPTDRARSNETMILISDD